MRYIFIHQKQEFLFLPLRTYPLTFFSSAQSVFTRMHHDLLCLMASVVGLFLDAFLILPITTS